MKDAEDIRKWLDELDDCYTDAPEMLPPSAKALRIAVDALEKIKSNKYDYYNCEYSALDVVDTAFAKIAEILKGKP